MTGYTLHLEAYADIDEIWEFIAQENLDAADRVRDEIFLKLSGALYLSPVKATAVPI